MMGLINETDISAYIRRRANIDDEKILNNLKKNVLNQISSKDVNYIIYKSIRSESFEIIDNLPNEFLGDADKLYSNVVNMLKTKFHSELVDFYNEMTKFPDDDGTYCFIKHSERYGGLQSRGFSECVKGWYLFLQKYGSWFGDLDWNEVKQKMDEKPNEKILIKKPLENHIYHYYFSVIKI
jgi:hypothetical protein